MKCRERGRYRGWGRERERVREGERDNVKKVLNGRVKIVAFEGEKIFFKTSKKIAFKCFVNIGNKINIINYRFLRLTSFFLVIMLKKIS